MGDIIQVMKIFMFLTLLSGTKNDSVETGGKDFKIIAFSDIHCGKNDGNANPPERVMKIIHNIVRRHKPKFIVFNGDQANEPGGFICLQQISQALTQYKTPWAVVFGNHDRDAGIAAESDLLEKYDDYCLFRRGSIKWDNISVKGVPGTKGDFEKYGNYAIDITDHGKPIYTAVFMDSGPEGTYIEPYQIEWYSSLMHQKSIFTYGAFDPASGRTVPSMLFMHQGIPEYQLAADTILGGKNRKGIIPPTSGFGEIRGAHLMQNEKVNHGLFKVTKVSGGTHVFVGHDHRNNANMAYDGLQLTYLNKISQNNVERTPEARVSFGMQILLSKRAGCKEATSADERQKEKGSERVEHCWAVSLSYAMPDGSTTRDCNAWQWIGTGPKEQPPPYQDNRDGDKDKGKKEDEDRECRKR